MHQHYYKLGVSWTGNLGTGTSSYDSYGRDHLITCEGKPDLQASSDPYFRGDASRYNPEDLFLAAISSCHMLWYLHLCADAGIVVTSYNDYPEGIMISGGDDPGRFIEVNLNPVTKISDPLRMDEANQIHDKAREKCFISNSCNFPITHRPRCIV